MQFVLAQGQPPVDLFRMFLPIVIIFVIFYLLLIRPERKRQKLQKQRYAEMLEGLKKNDRVVTKGGIHGVVKAVRPDDVLLLVDESNNSRLRFEKRAIARVISKQEGELTAERG